jgi:hypothetical protein
MYIIEKEMIIEIEILFHIKIEFIYLIIILNKNYRILYYY